MNKTSNNTIIWNSYLETINLPHQAHIYDYCQSNSSIAIDILDRFDESYTPSLDIRPGWIPIVFSLHNKILSLVNDYKIYQIKQKFGTLRFYAYPIVLDATSTQNRYHIDQIYNHLVQTAEKQSATTCEICSATAKLTKNHYRYETLCSNCA
jgi:hypothetical protein